MNAENMMATIISTVSLSLSASLSSSGSTDTDGTVVMKKVFLVPFIPHWESLSNEKAPKFCIKIYIHIGLSS
jgi:hypothetical protein